MTDPTVEEAMERLRIQVVWAEEVEKEYPPGDPNIPSGLEDLATIRKHIEDLERIGEAAWAANVELREARQTIEDLTEASQVERAAALVTIEELTEERDGAEATERDAWKQVEEQERTIEELQRRIEELEKALQPYLKGVGWLSEPEDDFSPEATDEHGRLPLPEPDEGSWNASAGR